MWRAFRQMQQNLFRVVEQQLITDSQLSGPDYAVLVPLSEAEGQRLRARDLGRVMEWERSRLSHQLRRMEQRGLVSRVGCPTDARGTFIELTPAGRAAVQRAAPSHVEAVRANFVDLMTAPEIAMFTDVCNRVLEHIRADGRSDVCAGEPVSADE